VEDTKGAIKIRISKNRQHNGEKKSTKVKTTIYKTNIYSQRSSNTSPTKYRGEIGCSRRVCRSCPTSGTHRVNLVTNQIITREWVRDRKVLTISGTNKWSLWHIYYITVNQVMVPTVIFSKWWLHLYQKEPLFL
jgi:hypothetical protein